MNPTAPKGLLGRGKRPLGNRRPFLWNERRDEVFLQKNPKRPGRQTSPLRLAAVFYVRFVSFRVSEASSRLARCRAIRSRTASCSAQYSSQASDRSPTGRTEVCLIGLKKLSARFESILGSNLTRTAAPR